MTTGLAEIVAIGDLRQVVLTAYRDKVLAVLTMPSGDVVLHRDGDAVADYTRLGLRGTKDKIAAEVIGESLHLAWSVGGQVFLCEWGVGLRQMLVQPRVVAQGRNPSMQLYQGTKLVIGYVGASGGHFFITSADGGTTWSAPVAVHDDPVADVDWYVTGSRPYEAEIAEARNEPPSVEPVVIELQADGGSDTYQVEATVGAGPGPLVFSMVDAPEWLTISGTGLLSWTVPSGSATGSYEVTAAVTDGLTFISFTFTFAWEYVYRAPVINAFSLSAIIGDMTLYQVTYVPGNGPGPDVFSLPGVGLPAWITISDSGLLTVAPPEGSDADSLVVTVALYDGTSTVTTEAGVSWKGGPVIANLTLWVDASDSEARTLESGAFSALADKSGLGNNLVQSTPGSRPALSAAALNGLDGALFDGIDDFLLGPVVSSLITAGAYTVFIVARPHTIAAADALPYRNHGLWMDDAGYVGTTLSTNYGLTAYNWDGAGKYVHNANVTTTGPHLIEQRFGGGNMFLRLDDEAEGTAASGNITVLTGLFRLGRAYSTFPHTHATVFEMLVYNRNLTEAERNQTRDYLKAKWGL